MRYFIDTEFLEGTQKRRFMGYELPSFFDTKSTIDLISIGIVAEDGRELYCISKDFNLEEAWNRYDLKPDINKGGMKRVYWIRENVLRPIFVELFIKDNGLNEKMCFESHNKKIIENKITYNWLKNLIDKYGKPNKQIAEEVKSFCYA